MSEEENKAIDNDILYEIDMQLYDEFNDKLAIMNEHLGDVYSLRDIEEVEQAEKEKEIKLLREAIRKQQKEIEELNEIKQQICNEELITQDYVQENFISKDKIREKIKYHEKLDEEYAKQGNFETEISLLNELLEE